MRILYFDDYKMGVVKDGKIVDVSPALDHHCIIPPNNQMENVIANFDSYRPKFEEIAAKSDGVAMDSVRLRAPLPFHTTCSAPSPTTWTARTAIAKNSRTSTSSTRVRA
jgi:hypothetical protein